MEWNQVAWKYVMLTNHVLLDSAQQCLSRPGPGVQPSLWTGAGLWSILCEAWPGHRAGGEARGLRARQQGHGGQLQEHQQSSNC